MPVLIRLDHKPVIKKRYWNSPCRPETNHSKIPQPPQQASLNPKDYELSRLLR